MNHQLVPGLEGVVVAETRLSDVDGEAGRLTIAGHDVEEIALRATVEDAFGLLWDGELPFAPRREEIRAGLAEGRERAFAAMSVRGGALRRPDGMDALRAGVAGLQADGVSATRDAFQLAGAVAVFAAAWYRLQQGLEPTPPSGVHDHADDYLRMCLGAEPTAAAVRALDSYLVTICDHGMNASTFTARVVASTKSDAVSCVTAAIGALKGPLHGGAPGPVLDMLDAIADPADASRWLQEELKAGRRIMGMGHRIYRVRDPRATILEQALRRLQTEQGQSPRLALAHAVECEAERLLEQRHPGRRLHANVEFYTAVLLEAVGLGREVFAPTFAVGRVLGWLAHIQEQRADKRIIRPGSVYVGPPARAVAAGMTAGEEREQAD